MRTNRTISFAAGCPLRHVQIVLRLYKTPAEVLLGFDLDCVGVGFDGTDVWALPRARRAVNYRMNVADPSRQTYRTTSYEYRLWKYRYQYHKDFFNFCSKRGFAVGVPGFQPQYVNVGIYDRKYSDLKGFAKLLYLQEREFHVKAIKLYTGINSQYRNSLKYFIENSDCYTRHGYKYQADRIAGTESLSSLVYELRKHVEDYNRK